MKKVFYFVAVAVVTLSMASCGGKSASVEKNPKATAIDDSISSLFGEGMGKQLSMQMNDSTNKDKQFDKQAFLDGLQVVLACDTSSQKRSYMMGLSQGLQMQQQTVALEQMYGINFDKKAFFDTFEKALSSTATEAELNALDARLQKLMQEAIVKSGKGTSIVPQGEAPATDTAKKEAQQDSKKTIKR